MVVLWIKSVSFSDNLCHFHFFIWAQEIKNFDLLSKQFLIGCWPSNLTVIGGDLVSTAKKTFGCGGFLKTTQPKKTFGCGGFLKSTQPKKTFGCGGFLSHKKMAVENMKSHFGCGICTDRHIVQRIFKIWILFPHIIWVIWDTNFVFPI